MEVGKNVPSRIHSDMYVKYGIARCDIFVDQLLQPTDTDIDPRGVVLPMA